MNIFNNKIYEGDNFMYKTSIKKSERNLLSGLFRSGLMIAGLLVFTGAFGAISSSKAWAWGPDRATFTIQKPADYATFNSIINSPYGDERNFVRIKEVGQSDEYYTDKIKLTPGKEYEVYTFFHNNAAANLNIVAQDTRVKAYIPNVIKAGQTVSINMGISSSNSNPKEVYDDVKVSTDCDVALRYVQDSAKLSTLFIKDVPLSIKEMLEGGALIGSYGPDGNVPGCNEHSGYVTYRFKVVHPDFTVKEEVRLPGQKTWAKEIQNVKAGDILEYRVVYRNTGTINQSNVHIYISLPNGMSYISGSTEINNAALGRYVNITEEADNYFKQNGWLRLGNYAPQANAIVRYKLKVEDTAKMTDGDGNCINTVSVVTENGTKQDFVKLTAQ